VDDGGELNPDPVLSTNNFFSLTLPGIHFRLSFLISAAESRDDSGHTTPVFRWTLKETSCRGSIQLSKVRFQSGNSD